MTAPFIGEIRMFGGNFAPRGWALCNGQLLSIAQNSALFALINTTYGGDGTTDFALPNLQSRVPIHIGTGLGLTARNLGEVGGTENVTLTTNEMPIHNHPLTASLKGPLNATPGGFIGGGNLDYFNTTPNTTASPDAVGFTGSSQPHNNIQPVLAISFIIALIGIFPSRN